ncbi:hypothetical protein [Roseomonas sp. AR75]|uniref:hypothetical protein n=1 Tax=Roseomonas sp. AR75 TaxID=2562311 RepID=UPI0010BF6A2C|nr:hypothetical protein [Roseomonas sp. AR75]
MPGDPAPVRVNRAPVLTLWATVVAERMGHPPDLALSLGSVVASTAARAKARRLGIIADAPRTAREPARRDTVRLLGRDVALTHDADGVVLADAGEGTPAPAAPIAAYLAKAFGPRLAEVRAAMQELAERHLPEDLDRVGFRLYEHFRPEVPADVRGWGAKGTLDLAKLRNARP